jgi:uncharacterized protein (TIGR03083 family)
MTTTTVDEIRRIEDRDEARSIALAVYESFVSDLERLSDEDWERVTVCTPWTVADVARHVLGAAESAASKREMARQQFAAIRQRKRFEGNLLDAINAFQVAERAHLDGPEVARRIRAVAADAVDGRLPMPGLLDRLAVPAGSGGSAAAGMPAKVRLGELFRVIYTRDVWLHRIDIADALGRTPALDTPADRRLIADVVREWADRHHRPFELRLAGGTVFHRGAGVPVIELEAVELCWILSGRAQPDPSRPGADLLLRRVLF